jgi:hypothetical protein
VTRKLFVLEWDKTHFWQVLMLDMAFFSSPASVSY